MRFITPLLLALLLLLPFQPGAIAKLDNYVVNYLKVRESVELLADGNGTMTTITAEQLSQGKRLFESNCLNCHVGGATLPNPTVALSLKDLSNATPRRDNLAALVEFQREPMTFDGFEESIECRQVPESWMDDETLTNLAAFVLKSAQSAPGWGSKRLDRN
ncbi:MAG: photosystem II cytochrome PsbV2 [Cyanobacteria bacterium P01_E01_bin.34]